MYVLTRLDGLAILRRSMQHGRCVERPNSSIGIDRDPAASATGGSDDLRQSRFIGR